ncbi:MAG: hypothetical protein FK732_09295 [Asgard group archaeon]|nr:hypothetical protein [Asgard group archaeon]
MTSLDTRLKHFQTKLRKVKDGIRPKNPEGKFGNKWWSKKWLETLEFFENDKRVVQGRFYAREGQIRTMIMAKGCIQAKVQGTKIKPYSITIKLRVLNDEEWQNVLEQMTRNAMLFSRLLVDKFPKELEEIFSNFRYPLFPKNDNDLLTSCTCADWANPCKHIAAVYYILSDIFEYDPFTLLFIRGKSRIEIREILRQYQNIITKVESKSLGKKIPAISKNQHTKKVDLVSFWKANPNVKLTDIVRISKIEREISNKGDFSEPKLVELLDLSYKKASEIVNNKLSKLPYRNN